MNEKLQHDAYLLIKTAVQTWENLANVDLLGEGGRLAHKAAIRWLILYEEEHHPEEVKT